MSQGDSTPAGRQMIAQLLQIHNPMRADIEVLDEALALLSNATADSSRVPEMIAGLTVAKFLWQLRVNCDYFCNVLNGHHDLEDHRMFPVMLRRFPELGPAVARLRSEHRQVHQLVTETKSAALNLTEEHRTVERAHAAIKNLAEHLRAHLKFEEDTMFPYFRRMDTDWHLG
ncbi:hemerythrin domain-containing protein [Nocardia inohanensis]|uniref:hemerythrin domain-containing protein n=1 Tax=Nocardia inohanensis TaxID=209246 RepID=UPI00082A5C0E|nr:hemerythrin domain-containing protein [Nocardia inohanensis]